MNCQHLFSQALVSSHPSAVLCAGLEVIFSSCRGVPGENNTSSSWPCCLWWCVARIKAVGKLTRTHSAVTALQLSSVLIVIVLMLSTRAAGTIPPEGQPVVGAVPYAGLCTVPKGLLGLDLKGEDQLCLLAAAPSAWDGGEAIRPSHRGSCFLKAGPITACCCVPREQRSIYSCPTDHSSVTPTR